MSIALRWIENQKPYLLAANTPNFEESIETPLLHAMVLETL
jgi:hypothetical protein